MSVYMFSSPLYGILNDSPERLDFHIQSGDFLSFVATKLGFFEERLSDKERAAAKELRNYLRYVQAKSDLQAKTQRIASYHREMESLTGQVNSYQRRIESAPQHEGAMAALMRDYETTRTQYQEMLSKQHEAQLGYQLDRVASSIVFRIVEPATNSMRTPSRAVGRVMNVEFAGLRSICGSLATISWS